MRPPLSVRLSARLVAPDGYRRPRPREWLPVTVFHFQLLTWAPSSPGYARKRFALERAECVAERIADGLRGAALAAIPVQHLRRRMRQRLGSRDALGVEPLGDDGERRERRAERLESPRLAFDETEPGAAAEALHIGQRVVLIVAVGEAVASLNPAQPRGGRDHLEARRELSTERAPAEAVDAGLLRRDQHVDLCRARLGEDLSGPEEDRPTVCIVGLRGRLQCLRHP